ncbi:DUF2865 domain-containing protein, partial [Rhodoplanes sp. TEM]
MIRILIALCVAVFCAVTVSQPSANDAFDFWRREWSGWGATPPPQPPSWGSSWGNPWGAPWAAPPRQPPSITITPRSRGTDSRGTESRSSGGSRAWCVRTCDGFYVPLDQGVSRAEAKRSCDAICPGTETAVFRGGADGPDGIADAVSSSGKRYGALPKAFSHRTALDAACRCSAAPKGALARLRQDATLVRGDIVVTEAGVHIFTGGGRPPHEDRDFTPYREAGRLPAKLKRYLSEIDRAYASAPERLATRNDAETREPRRAETRAE